MSNLVTSAAAVAARPRTRKPYGRALVRLLVVNPIKSVGSVVKAYWQDTGNDLENAVGFLGFVFGGIAAIIGLFATVQLTLVGLLFMIPGNIVIAGAFTRRFNAEVKRIMED
jgi:hypothetical protein